MPKNKNIKNILEERQIEPSADAWNKLKAQLDENYNDETFTSKNNNKIILYGIVASILLIVLTTLFININNTPLESSESPTLTQTKEITIPSNQYKTIHTSNETEKEQFELTQTKVQSEGNQKKLSPQPKIKNSSPNLTEEKVDKPSFNTIDSVVHVDLAKEIFIKKDNPLVDNTTKQSFDETDSIVLLSADELLAQALKKHQFMQEQKAIAIDSKQLLNIVEEDIFIENKPDLLNKLTQQFKSIQVALNERNKE